MEKSEPSLVPEWLKSNGSSYGGGTTIPQFVSSSLQSDDRAASKPARNKSLGNIRDQGLGQSPVSPDRITSAYFRRSSSSNGSAHSRSYSSFGRTHPSRDWDKDVNGYREKEKTVVGGQRSRNYVEPSRFEKDGLRRSHSMVSGKDKSDANGILNSPIRRVNKAVFERDFPSLGAEERRLDTELGCVSSGSSAVIGGDGWTSALAEVPGSSGKNGTGSASMSSSTVGGLNMAETLAQGPPHVHVTTQVSVGTQRFEELAVKQSRQLIPMTPSMPKSSQVLNMLEKPKPKVGQQQQHRISSPHLVSLSPRGGPGKPDAAKTSGSAGKLHVLKPAREMNSISPPPKDNLSPTSIAPPVGGHAVLLDKKPTSQAKSRNEFFNLMRKKSMTNSSSSSSAAADPKPDETEAADAFPQSDEQDGLNKSQLIASSDDMANNGDACEEPQKLLDNETNHSSSFAFLCSEEEEAAFLRSLGWEENTEEDDEGLTEEEISGFYKDVTKHIESKPSSRIFQGMQSRFPMLAKMQIESVGGISSGLCPSESKLES